MGGKVDERGFPVDTNGMGMTGRHSQESRSADVFCQGTPSRHGLGMVDNGSQAFCGRSRIALSSRIPHHRLFQHALTKIPGRVLGSAEIHLFPRRTGPTVPVPCVLGRKGRVCGPARTRPARRCRCLGGNRIEAASRIWPNAEYDAPGKTRRSALWGCKGRSSLIVPDDNRFIYSGITIWRPASGAWINSKAA